MSWMFWKKKPGDASSPQSGRGARLRIVEVAIEPGLCTCSQLCVEEAPDILDGNTPTGVPRVREGAEALFESKAEQIEAACDVCPVDAIKVTRVPA